MYSQQSLNNGSQAAINMRMPKQIRRRYYQIGGIIKTKNGKVVSVKDKHNGIIYKVGDIKCVDGKGNLPIDRFSYENGRILAWIGSRFQIII